MSLVNLRLGGHVDTLRRLVEDDDDGFRCQPAGQGHLLLIAAGQVADLGIDRWRFHTELVYVGLGEQPFPVELEEAAG